MYFNKETLQKMLLYIFGIIVTYSMLRFIPSINMEKNKALVVTLIIFIIYTALYFVYRKISDHVLNQNIIDEAFNTCNKDCKVDSVNNIEGFEQTKDTNINISQTTTSDANIIGTNTPAIVTPTITPVSAPVTPNVITSGQVSPTVPLPIPPVVVAGSDASARSNVVFSNNTNGKCRVVCDNTPPTRQVLNNVPGTTTHYYPDYTQIGYNPNYYPDGMFYDQTAPPSQYVLNQSQIEVNRDQQIFNQNIQNLEHQARDMGGYPNAYQIPGSKSEYLKQHKTVGVYLDNPADDLQYTNYNHLPLAAGYKSSPDDYGFSYLPTEKMFIRFMTTNC